MILGLSGYAKSGKDTMATYLIEKHGFEKAAFAGVLRDCMAALNPIVFTETEFDEQYEVFINEYRYNDLIRIYGYDTCKEMFPEFRELLQRMGTEVGRNLLGENIWVDAAMNKLDPNKNYVFTDVRFLNEYEAVRKAGGLMVRINRLGFGPVNNHPSEISLDHMEFDVMLNNDNSQRAFEAKVEALHSELTRDSFFDNFMKASRR